MGEIKYTRYESLESELREKYPDDMDFEVEKRLLPRGGTLYVLDKKYFARNPLVPVSISSP